MSWFITLVTSYKSFKRQSHYQTLVLIELLHSSLATRRLLIRGLNLTQALVGNFNSRGELENYVLALYILDP